MNLLARLRRRPVLRKLNAREFVDAKNICLEEFSSYLGKSMVRRILNQAEIELSIGIFRGRKMVGVYLGRSTHLPPSVIYETPDLSFLSERLAMQGHSLVVLKSERGKGYGKKLRMALPVMAREMGFEFLWGGALHELGNKADWLKRRALLQSSGDCNITVEPLTEELKIALWPWAATEARAHWSRSMSDHCNILPVIEDRPHQLGERCHGT